MALLLCCSLILGLLVLPTYQVLMANVEMTSREGNRLSLMCEVTSLVGSPSQLQQNERVDFLLNSMPVDDITAMRDDLSIVVDIDPRHEGFFTCSIYDTQGMITIATSASIGPIASHPMSSINHSTPLFYVGFVGSTVTLLPVIPLGAFSNLYTYTWSNGTNHDVSGMAGFLQNKDRSLSIASLKSSHNGSYSLTLQVDGWPESFHYRNDNYNLQLQETPHFNNNATSIIRVISDNQRVDQILRCSVQGYPDVSIEWRHNNLSIENDGKYQISYTFHNEAYIANSTLIIRTLDATDNGVVSCVASTNGCNITLSRDSCHHQVIEEKFDTKLSVITTQFRYNVTVLSEQNLELRIQSEGRPIPEAVRVYVQYIDEETQRDEVFKSDSSYTNASYIYLFIPQTSIPLFTLFRIRVALGTDTMIAPYKTPIRDVVYDINDPDVNCDKQRLYLVVAIAVPCVLGGIIFTAIVALLILAICLKKNKNKLKMTAEKLAERYVEDDLNKNRSPREKAEAFREVFEITYRTIADGADENDEESSYVDTSVKMKMTTPLGASRVVADGEEFQEASICVSREWIKTTDMIFSSIHDEKKKSDLLHHLFSVIKEEDLMPKEGRQTVV